MDIAYCIRISPGRSTADGDWIRTRVNNVFQLLNEDVTTSPDALRLENLSNLGYLYKRDKSSRGRSMTAKHAKGRKFEPGWALETFLPKH